MVFKNIILLLAVSFIFVLAACNTKNPNDPNQLGFDDKGKALYKRFLDGDTTIQEAELNKKTITNYPEVLEEPIIKDFLESIKTGDSKYLKQHLIPKKDILLVNRALNPLAPPALFKQMQEAIGEDVDGFYDNYTNKFDESFNMIKQAVYYENVDVKNLKIDSVLVRQLYDYGEMGMREVEIFFHQKDTEFKISMLKSPLYKGKWYTMHWIFLNLRNDT